MDAKSAVTLARSRIHGEVHNEHCQAIFDMVKLYNAPECKLLEIGVKHGFTLAIMAMACPLAKLLGVNPSLREIGIAKKNLAPYKNVELVCSKSWDYLPECQTMFDVIFVDGDHNNIAKDLPWWTRVRDGGLMLFHDYDYNHSRIVFNQLNQFLVALDKAYFDFHMDINGNGLVGLYK